MISLRSTNDDCASISSSVNLMLAAESKTPPFPRSTLLLNVSVDAVALMNAPFSTTA